MEHFPIFMSMNGQRVVVCGGGAAAEAKLRLLMKTTATLSVYSLAPDAILQDWARAGQIDLHTRPATAADFDGALMAYAADEDAALDKQTMAMAHAAGVLVNVVDDLGNSQFITPAIVDRDPVVVAIGTEGAAPVLARAIKADVEERLPIATGTLARMAKDMRPVADTLPKGKARRAFWSAFFSDAGPRAAAKGVSALRDAFMALLDEHRGKTAAVGHVAFVGAGPGDPELLTLKARRALDEADVVIHDRLISPEVLELARREATLVDVGKTGFGPSTSQATINDLIVEHAQRGAHVVRLKSGDSTVFGRLDEEIDACTEAGVEFSIVPGITAASAAVAAIGQSLTKRGRNSSVRFLTGHDMAGFANHDWTTLAQQGEVAAIYMGKKAAHFVQGRLLMHGADPATPVTLIENASRSTQRVIASRLDQLTKDIDVADITGPVLTFYGLAPRDAAQALPDLKQELA